MRGRAAAPALTLFCFAIFMAWQALRLRLGALNSPGPGFFPFWMAVGLALASLALLLPRPSGPEGPPGEATPAPLRGVLMVTGGLAAYGALLDVLGFVLASFGFLIYLWAAIDRQPLLRSVLRAGISVSAAYLLFDSLLRVQFPRGPLPF